MRAHQMGKKRSRICNQNVTVFSGNLLGIWHRGSSISTSVMYTLRAAPRQRNSIPSNYIAWKQSTEMQVCHCSARNIMKSVNTGTVACYSSKLNAEWKQLTLLQFARCSPRRSIKADDTSDDVSLGIVRVKLISEHKCSCAIVPQQAA